MCSPAAAVAGSCESTPASTESRAAASATVRVIGPAVSCVCEMGIMPVREISPTVGLMPTIPQLLDGETMEPSVSLPTATAQRLDATAVPEPELDPDGLRSNAYGFLVRPPRPLHPLVEWLERMFAHSLRLVLPRITAPAARNLCATKESFCGFEPTSASDPAVVIMRSVVSMLSL